MFQKKPQAVSPSVPVKPQWETRSKVPLNDGRVPGIDNSMWLYRSVPMSPIVDAKTVEEAVKGGRGLHTAFEQLAELATPGLNRNSSKSTYREFHVLLLNVPTYFRAPESSPIRDYLNAEFRDRLVLRRELLFGVKLKPLATGGKKGKDGLLSAIDSVAYSLSGDGGSPLSDYDHDTALVSGALARAGLTLPSVSTLRWADSWWGHGAAKGVPILPHGDHLHFVTSMQAKTTIERDFDIESCADWPEEGIPGEHAITFSAMHDLTLDPTPVAENIVRWVPELLEQHARVVSIRGLVEPQSITRKQLASQKTKWSGDIDEYFAKNKTPREEQEVKRAALAQMEASYARGEAPATLVDCSVIVGFDAVVEDLRRITPRAITLNPLINLQPAAWYETMLCSSVRANPLKQELPATAIAYSGIQNISRVGDESGALFGFTERDGQPVYISNAAASAGDASPLAIIAAGTGSGKTTVMQWTAHQWGLMKVPQVILDPKRDSDLEPAVRASGGNVVSFDEFASSDGALDPLRFNRDPSVGAALASDMISRIRPWTHYETQQHETAIAYAIQYGVSRGAQATGQALKLAEADGVIAPEVVADIFKVAESYPMFRATFGINPETPSLTVSEGITLFKVGRTQFELPPVGAQFDPATASPLVRTSVNLLRMIVRASMVSLSGRAGVLHMDEGWVLQQAAPDELEQIGRLARSQNVLPMLYTQTPSGPLNAGLKNFTSRGAIGHISDEFEARAGMSLFGAENDELVSRVTEKEYLSGGAGVNWNSLKALWSTDSSGKRTLLRPAVFFHSDLKNSIAPVEVWIPQSFLDLASTNPEDVRRREAKRALHGTLAG